MAILRLGMTMSVDGFVADETGDLGILYTDFEVFVASEAMQREIAEVGAVVMGRHAFDLSRGDWTGYEYQVPIFVVTHQAPTEPLRGENENLVIHFVTDGLESAVRQAKAAAGEKVVVSMGGALTARQLLNLGLVDELQVDIMPILLRRGLRFFDGLDGEVTNLERVSVESINGRTSLRYWVTR